ncbi:MAG TPA: Fic family protein, partial [Holophaga sp.]|nr:Fic family protein [Holophaga sp.]
HHLQAHPIASPMSIAKAENLSPATVNKALDLLTTRGLTREITGGQRNRLFAYDLALKILTEGTEAL